MPDRMIRERSRASLTLAKLSDGAERAWWRLTVTCDDHGRFDADPEVLCAELFKRKPAGWTIRRMARGLEEWDAAGLVHVYAAVSGAEPELRIYGHVVTWPKYQRLRESKPRYPEPPCGGDPFSDKCRESRQTAASRGELPLARAAARGRASESVSVSEEVSSIRSRSKSSPRGEPPQGAAAVPSWPSPEALVQRYNAESPDECPAVKTLSAARRKKARQYLAEFPAEAWWREVFAQLHRSRFLRGLMLKHAGHASFVADLDWLLSKGKDGSENVVKVHDGKYRDGDGSP